MVFLPLMTMHLPKYAPFRAMVSYAAAPLSPWRSATGPSAVPPAPPCRSPGPLCILSQCSRLVRSRPTPQGAGRFRPSSIRAAALPCRIPQAYSPPAGNEQPVFTHRDGFSRKPQKATVCRKTPGGSGAAAPGGFDRIWRHARQIRKKPCVARVSLHSSLAAP